MKLKSDGFEMDREVSARDGGDAGGGEGTRRAAVAVAGGEVAGQ